MSLKEKLSTDMKAAMKAKDKARLAYCRNLHAAVRKTEIDTKVDLDDAGFLKIVNTQAKQRRDAIEQFQKGGRDDLVENESAELKFLEEFMPEQMSDEELEKLVSDAVAESGASSPKDMGKVMQLLIPKTEGKADGKKVSQLVRSKLT